MRRISAAAALTVGLGINNLAVAGQSIYPQVAQTLLDELAALSIER
jgi:hypothetical protein